MGKVKSRVRDFNRMNPRDFHGSKVENVPQVFIKYVYIVLMIMVVKHLENAELGAYQVKGVAQTWSTNGKKGDQKTQSSLIEKM